MTFALSLDDRAFLDEFESSNFPPSSFHHREHLRLAYAVLVENQIPQAAAYLRNGLRRYLAAHRINPGKYHETLTCAWLLAVRHFMDRTPVPTADFAAFIDQHPHLLRSEIMLTHYQPDTLSCPEARTHFIAPDLAPIPSAPPFPPFPAFNL